MVSVNSLKVEFNAVTLFDDVSFVINSKDRIALVGKNGAGKSTLLKILAGLQRPSGGTVSIPRDCTVGYLPQVMNFTDTRTVRQEVEQAFEEIFRVQAEVDDINRQLQERSANYEGDAYQKLIEKLTYQQERLQLLGGGNYQAEMERTLTGLGFRRSDFDRLTSEFSGGWRMRIEIAKLLLRHPDVLLLDEPTNHLDIESIGWLENFLATRANAVMLVSHDRAFLNNVTTRTIEISCGRIYDYRVKYDEFVTLRKERREQQMRAYLNQQRQIEDTREFIERFRYKATKAVQVQSRIKQLEKIVPIAIDEEDTSTLRLKFTCSMRSGNYPIICEEVGKCYSNQQVFDGVTFTISRGEKVAFVGKNGEGKTTLVKCIMQEVADYTGTITLGHNVQIGYFAQNQAQLLDGNLTVFETIDHVATGDIRLKIRDILGAFMFGGEASDKKVKVLSGGERTRLAMIKLLLEPVNLLILDEPTNHLDMRSKDVLKEAIHDFDGTVIVVSHDRDFLDGLVTKVYEFADGHVREHLGGIYDFLRTKQEQLCVDSATDSMEQLLGGRRNNGMAAESLPEGRNKTAAQDYAERKELNKKIKKLERQVADCETEIGETESAIAILEAQMATPGGVQGTSIFEKHARLKQKLDRVMEEWETALEELEKLRN